MLDEIDQLETVKTINFDNDDFKDKPSSKDFEIKKFEQIVKIPDCSYVNETSVEKFFHCPCLGDRSPICTQCAKICHKTHNPFEVGTSNFVCSCGKSGHPISTYESKEKSPCLYDKFFEIIPNDMYTTFVDKNINPPVKETLCLVCKNGCYGKNLDENSDPAEENNHEEAKFKFALGKSFNMGVDPKKKYCECRENHDFPHIQINDRFLNNKNLKGFMLNFNVNIMFKIQKTKQLYIDEFKDAIENCIKENSEQIKYQFFDNWTNFKILEMFSLFFQNWKTKYTTIAPFLENSPLEGLLDLLSIPQELLNRLRVGNVEKNIISGKLYFAELLINYYIKSIFVKSNNLFSMTTIINMPLEYRNLYIHNASKFHEYKNSIAKEGTQKDIYIDNEINDWNLIDKLSSKVILMFEEITKYIEQLSWDLLETAFTTFNRLIKNLIKYNILSDELKTKYLKILLDSLQSFNKKKRVDLRNTSLSIMKILVYLIVYKNDEKCFQLLGAKKGEKVSSCDFSFVINDFNMRISKIFLYVIKHKNTLGSVSKQLQFDYCVKKYNELMLFTRDSYFYSICNCQFKYNDLLHSCSNNLTKELIENINPKQFNSVRDFISKMNNENQCYFLYGQSLELYLKHVIKIFVEFKRFYQSNNQSPSILNTDDYAQMEENDDFKKSFLESILILPFFQKIEELIYIYAKGKDYFTESCLITQPVDKGMIEVFEFIIEINEALLESDPSLINILMNTKPAIFIRSFMNCNRKILFDYLNKLVDICISRIQFKGFDSFSFFTGCILELIKKYSTDYVYLPDIMRFSSKIMRNIFAKEESFLTVIEQYSDLFKTLSNQKELIEFFIDENTKMTPEEKARISNFYEAYFIFLCDLLEYDCFFYDYIKTEIISVQSIYEKIRINYSFNPMLKAQIMRYYFLISLSFNFKMTKSAKQMEIIFKDIKSMNDINIPFISFWPNDPLKKGNNFSFKNFIEICLQFNTSFIDSISNKQIRLSDQNLLEWYEHVMIRPYYKLLSLSLLDLKSLSGSYINKVYEVVLSFIRATFLVYDTNRNIASDLMLSIKTQLTPDDIKEIEEKKEQLISEVKYYEIDKIVNCFISILKLVLNTQKDNNEVSNNPILQLILNKEITAKSSVIHYNMVNEYLSQKNQCTNDKLVLIKTISLLQSETDLRIREDIIDYFCLKLFCPMTEKSTRPIDNMEFEIKNAKLQNNYSLLFLNKYISHDSKNFQDSFCDYFMVTSTTDNVYQEQNKQTFLTYLSQNLIFPSILNETEKLYSLDMISDNKIGRFVSLSYKFGKYSLKFIQNLCEGYNFNYQIEFFNSYFCYKTDETNQIKDEEHFELKLKSLDSQQEEDENKRSLFEVKSFLNFLSCNMRIINQNLYQELKIQRDVFQSMISVGKSLDNIKGLYKGITDLVIEMIQGTHQDNFVFIYQNNITNDLFKYFRNQLRENFGKTKEKEIKDKQEAKRSYRIGLHEEKLENLRQITMGGSTMSGPETRPTIVNTRKEETKIELLFQLMLSAIETRDILYDQEDLFNPTTLDIKKDIFNIINNIINQDCFKNDIIELLSKMYSSESLVEVVNLLVKGLYVKHVLSIDYEQESFKSEFKKLHFTFANISTLTTTYEDVNKIYSDDFFSLASQIYLFVTIMAEKYHKIEDRSINIYKDKCSQLTENPPEEGFISKIKGFFIKPKPIDEKTADNNEIIYTWIFMSKIIKKCEFKIHGLCTLYFVSNPSSFHISKNTIESFKKNVDRKSSTTKLRALVDSLDLFMDEIEGNQNQRKIDFKKCVLYNFYLSLFINSLLLIFLNGVGLLEQSFLFYLISILIIGQLLFNMAVIFLFLRTKYSFYLKIGKKKLGPDPTPFDYMKLYVFDSFMFNNEIYLINYVFLLGILGTIAKYRLFFYIMQLIIVLDFVDTIREIVIAFQMRFSQLFCMIAFLFILLYFYSNIGFYFYIDEFNTVIESIPENYCQTMIECTLTYFNHGVRAGGGIGDVLGDKSFTPSGVYYLRFTTDMIFYITVILLLLNMINGVIVSTFSQIREESNQKEEDIKNICYICNIERKEFEKRKLDFDKHQLEEHNLITYINFFIMLKLKEEKDLDKTQAEILKCLKNKQNSCFPVKMTKSFGEL